MTDAHAPSRRGGGRDAKRAARLAAVSGYPPFITRNIPYVELLGEEIEIKVTAQQFTMMDKREEACNDNPDYSYAKVKGTLSISGQWEEIKIIKYSFLVSVWRNMPLAARDSCD